MSVYIFTLNAGYTFGGVDTSQGYRARMLEHVSYPVKFIFTELPTRRDIIEYKKVGIKLKQMLSMHQYFTDNHILEPCGKAEDKLVELMESLDCKDVKRLGHEIWLIRDGAIIASIHLVEENREFYYGVSYFKQARLIRTEIYTEGIAYANYYVTAKSNQGEYAKLVRRTFYNKDGEDAYNQILVGNKEYYLFSNGRVYTKQQFVAEFIKKLDLKEQDVVLLDRAIRFDNLQPIFQLKKRARLIVVIHARHFYEKGEDSYRTYLAEEYNYCFKYSEMIDTMIVSTQEQKRELEEKLREYQCSIPKVMVIPAGGIEKLRYPDLGRQPHSLISVSRIDRRKKFDWIVKGVIKAHQVNANIFIDIYGYDEGYLGYLKDIVSQNQAQSYIRFMGWRDVTEVYKNYELYVTTSLGETLGLSLMEAVSSGMAMLGLDVKYGNRLFIQPGKNGYLIDFHTDYVDVDDEEMTDRIAEKIIEIFADEKRLEEFHRNSYEIAKEFSFEVIKEKWLDLLGE